MLWIVMTGVASFGAPEARSQESTVPLVTLDSGAIVGYEALARGPVGDLEGPDQLFDAARRAERLSDLDALCRRSALHGAITAGIVAPLTLFVNVEPEILDVAQLGELINLALDAPGELEVVLEITERALSTRPAELLATVERLRADGWKIALDDVGAEEMSLAFMALLRPEVVKLDLRLVQQRPSPAIAEIMNAVNAYSERSGALVLAEGIESEAHLQVAHALGATLGQGWLLGRPGPATVAGASVDQVRLPSTQAAHGADVSPFACLPAGAALRRSAKPLLVEVSKHLEREAVQLGSTCLLIAAFQEARHFTALTARRYRTLVESIAFTAALAADLPIEPIDGVRGATLHPTDPLVGEWDVVVLAPHFAAAMLARELGRDAAGAADVPDMERTFEFALTYDRDVVVAAAHSLMSRVTAEPSALARRGSPASGAA